MLVTQVETYNGVEKTLYAANGVSFADIALRHFGIIFSILSAHSSDRQYQARYNTGLYFTLTLLHVTAEHLNGQVPLHK